MTLSEPDRAADLAAALRELAAIGGRRPEDWQVFPLAGSTGRSYRLSGQDGESVLRLAARTLGNSGTGENENETVAANLGLAPAILAEGRDGAWRLTRFLPGRPLTPADFAESARLRRMAELLNALHRSDPVFRGLRHPSGMAEIYLAAAADPSLFSLRRAFVPLFDRLARAIGPLVPNHIDPHPGNVLADATGRLYLVDWEFSAMSEALWDVAVFAIEAELDPADEAEFAARTLSPEDRWRLADYKIALRLVIAAWAVAESRRRGGDEALAERASREIFHLGSLLRRA